MGGISYIGFAINFGIQLILVRLLIPEDFGSFALGLAAANILFILFAWNFSMAVIQIQQAEDLFDTAFYLSFLAGLIILAVGGAISFFLARYYPISSVMVFFIICATQPLRGCASIYSASLEKELKFRNNAIARGLSTNLSGFLAILMASLGFGVWSLVGREVLSTGFLLFGMRAMSSYRFRKRFNKQTARALLEFAYKRLFISGLEIAYFSGPIFLIGSLVTPRELGLFSQAFYLAGLPNTFLAPVQQNVAFSVYAKVQADRQKLQQAFDINYFFSLRFLIPMSLIVYLFPEQILSLLYGAKWLQAAPVLQSLSLYVAFVALTMSAVTFLYSLRMKDIMKVYVMQIITFVIVVTVFMGILESKVVLAGSAYSMSSLIGFSIGLYFIRNAGIKIGSQKMFLLPLTICFGIAGIWQLLIAPRIILIHWGSMPIFAILAMAFILFVLTMFLSEPKKSQYYFKYVVNQMTTRNIE
jgi:O-antigen/teichoic acid export membrane protein